MNDIGLFASEINNFIFSSLRSKDHTQIGGIQIWRTFRYSNNRVFLSFQKEYDGRQEPVAVLRMIIIAFAAYILNYLRRFWALTVPDNPAACLHWTSKVMLSERPGPDGGGGGVDTNLWNVCINHDKLLLDRHLSAPSRPPGAGQGAEISDLPPTKLPSAGFGRWGAGHAPVQSGGPTNPLPERPGRTGILNYPKSII